MASFSASFSSVSYTSAYFRATFSGGEASDTKRLVGLEMYPKPSGWSSNPNVLVMTTTSNRTGATYSGTISGLSEGTTYDWTATLGYRDGNDYWLDDYTRYGSFTTDEHRIEITPWSWSASNGAATAAQTRTAYQFITGQISTSSTSGYFSYKVWNDLIDKANELVTAVRGKWDTYYTTASGAKVSSGEKLSAAKFNSLRNNVDLVYNTGVGFRKENDPIYGEYFTMIADAINNGISNL